MVTAFASSNLLASLSLIEFFIRLLFHSLTLLRTIWVFGLVTQAMCGHFGSCISGIFFFLFCLCFCLLPVTMVCLTSFVLGSLADFVPLGLLLWLSFGFCFSQPAASGIRFYRIISLGIFLAPGTRLLSPAWGVFFSQFMFSWKYH